MRYQNALFIVGFILTAGCSAARFSVVPLSDTFAQTTAYNSDVDMLWVVDNSDSMEKRQETIASQIAPFISGLRATKMNFHMSFTTTDMRELTDTAHGRLLPVNGSIPKVLTPSSADLIGWFSQLIVAGGDGSTIEQGLAAMKRALSEPYASTVNSGFLRDGSFLVLLFLSDEDDQSPQEDFKVFLDDLRPNLPSGDRGWMAHYIGVTENDASCKSEARGYTDPGSHYISLANASGGTVQTICTADFAMTLQNIKARIIERITQYTLTNEPQEDTIQVLVNGVVVPKDAVNGWTYSAENRTITFHGSALPAADVFIKVNYLPTGAS